MITGLPGCLPVKFTPAGSPINAHQVNAPGFQTMFNEQRKARKDKYRIVTQMQMQANPRERVSSG